MTQTTFDPSDTGGWHLSNDDLTATSPDNNTKGSIAVGYGDVAIPDHAKTYFTYTVSGAAIQTAFNVGFGVHGFDPSNVNIAAEGDHISNATFMAFAYNLTQTNSGNVVADPQGNATYAADHPGAIAAPNQWPNGSVIGVMVDRVDNTVEFTLNGQSQGVIDISGLAGKTIYPFVDSWYKSGPVATINGNPGGTPAGYTNLNNAGSGGSTPVTPPVTVPPVTANQITVNEPTKLTAGTQTITGHETNASQPVFVDWRTTGTPSATSSDAVQATVSSNGNFTASVTIDHAGEQSTMFAGSSGALTAEWSATPAAATSSPPPVVTPPPVVVPPVVGQPPTVTIGSGSDTLALKVSEDAYLGNGQFTVSVDGKQIGGTQTTVASHAAGQTQTFDVMGDFAAGNHTATVDFLNDAYGGAKGLDRNLYVTGASIDNSVVSSATLSELVSGPQSFSFMAPGSGSASPPPPASNTVTVNHPENLAAAVQNITGMETDPSQPVFLDWHTYGAPAISANDWVQAQVQSNGQFSASMTIDHLGTMSTMYEHAGSGPVVAAWSGTPT